MPGRFAESRRPWGRIGCSQRNSPSAGFHQWHWTGRFVCTILVLATCGRGSPTRPTTTATPSPPLPWTVGGRVTATLAGEGVGGVRLASGQLEAWTDEDGRFAFHGDGNGFALSVRAEHPSFVPRETRLTWARSRDDVALDMIRDVPPFSLDFYRELVRAAIPYASHSGELVPLRRWTTAPAWYLNAETVDTGEEVPVENLDQVETALRNVVPLWTAGAFAASAVERGTTPPTGPGWITVRFLREPSSEYEYGPYCGRAQVAANPGWIEIVLRNCCDDVSSTAAHEAGHALGFFHVSGMRTERLLATAYPANYVGCRTRAVIPSEIEQYHARIAYSRQPGNTDPDVDPGTVFLAQPGYSKPLVAVCR